MSDAIPWLGSSKVRRRILMTFFSTPELVVHVRELSRRLGIPHGLVQRELRQLETWGILTSELVGRARRYRFDERSPVAVEVRSVFRRTAGIDQRLRNALGQLPGIEAAAIFGSYAAGTDRPGSDVDVLIVGDPDRVALSDQLAPVEQEIGREVNTTVLSRSEFDRLRATGSGFLSEVLARPLIGLAGRFLQHEDGDG